MLNLAQVFFGIGLLQTPGRNFARFLFMMFTILCLVIRTAYQGKMFDFLQYDVKQPIATSIQEVIDRQIPVKFLTSDEVFGSDDRLLESW